MPFRDIISLASGVSADKIPDGHQILGRIMLLKFPQATTKKEKSSVAEAILKNFLHVDTICEINGVEGEFRTPNATILQSRLEKPILETIHKEHGISYKLHVGKTMFSKGNLNERQRLISMIQPGETVVDMFAGIGYFSLGLAKFSRAKRIYAIEKNRIAFEYLKENISLNKIKGIELKRADCRKTRIKEKADRVIMGYFPGTELFLPHAFRFLKEKGIIHYHNIYKENELWEKPLKEIEDSTKKAGFSLKTIMGRNMVKSYAPRVWHVCVDFAVERK